MSNILLNRIQTAKAHGQYETAIDGIRRLIQSDAPMGRSWETLLAWSIELADEDASLECAKQLSRAFPTDPKCELILAERFARTGQSEIALDIIQKQAATAPPNPALDYFEGTYLGQLGELDQAEMSFRAAVSKKPDFGDAWALLSSLSALQAADEPILRQICAAPGPQTLPGAAYALGHWYDGIDDKEQAWQYWTVANRFQARKSPVQIADHLKQMDLIKVGEKRLALPTIAKPAHSGSPRPIFIVGPPRSGTSLIEQMLSRSNNVCALGETTMARLATWPLGDFTEKALEASGAYAPVGYNWQRSGQIYRTISGMRAFKKTVVTEKAVMLHAYVGALARMLPDAKFIWLKRDTRDVALSCYKANLADGNPWRHEITSSLSYLKAHAQLMSFWKDRFPDRVLQLEYEQFVADPDAGTQTLAAFCDLPGIDNVQDRNPQRRAITTASFAQVRKPITAKSVGGWKRYARWIDPAHAA